MKYLSAAISKTLPQNFDLYVGPPFYGGDSAILLKTSVIEKTTFSQNKNLPSNSKFKMKSTKIKA